MTHRQHRPRAGFSTRVALSTATLAVAGSLAGCGPEFTGPPATRSTSSITASSPTATAATGEALAYASAEESYRAWLASWIAASVAFDETKLNADVATPTLLKAASTELSKFQSDAEKGVAGRFTQDIKSIKGVTYEPGVRVVLAVCAVTNSRFIQGGKDVTRSSPNGPPAPVNTTARRNEIGFATLDGGGTWRVDYFVPSANEGKPC
jgi:hypothetical protein